MKKYVGIINIFYEIHELLESGEASGHPMHAEMRKFIHYGEHKDDCLDEFSQILHKIEVIGDEESKVIREKKEDG